MPTGYTAMVVEEAATFEQFALRCARAFGALVNMRDAPMDAPLPERILASAWYEQRLEETHAEIERLQKLSAEQLRQEADDAYTRAMATYHERVATRERQRAAYQAMLTQVEAWQPPSSDHVGLKTFMISQLGDSLRFDCGERGEEHERAPVRQAPHEWLARQLDLLRQDLVYYENQHREEVARTHERNEWLSALRRSLQHR